jgi:hypothetical protein
LFLPTPYVDINEVLRSLLAEVRAILGDAFVGMYLSGSLALGDFEPLRSDIDFVVVTSQPLADELIEALAAMHERFAVSGSRWASVLEGYYLPAQALRRHDPAQAMYPRLSIGGMLRVERQGSSGVILRHILREKGVALAGPELRPLIDPVAPDELREVVRALLHEWWAPTLDDPSRLQSTEYQAYAILTMCRVLYTLQYGTIVSKAVAARWAMQTLGPRWARSIDRALAWPREPQPDNLAETLALIRDTLARSPSSA